MTFGLAFTIGITLGLAGVLVLAHLHDRHKRVVTCPACNGDGTIPVAHPSGDPQRESERECIDCVGEGLLTAGELEQLTPARRLGERIMRELARNGHKVVISEYAGMPMEKRWEAGATDNWGAVIAGPYTAPTYLGAVSQVAQKLNVDVRRITS